MIRAAALLAVVIAGLAQDPQPSERTIQKQPSYVAEPRYGVLVLNEAKRIEAFAVFDKSNANLAYYDVLYLDKNCNGDLTESGERYAGAFDLVRERIYFPIGELRSGGESWYRKVRFSTWVKEPKFMLEARWNNKVNLVGGHGEFLRDMSRFGESPATAPVLYLEPNGPLAFSYSQVGSGEVGFAIGKPAHVAFSVGRRGKGAESVMALDEHFLDLEEDRLHGEIIGHDVGGRERRIAFDIRKHC